jgi:hypothetical protein
MLERIVQVIEKCLNKWLLVFRLEIDFVDHVFKGLVRDYVRVCVFYS